MQQRIFSSEVGGKPAICFDTGLEPRSFARTKMSQSLIEPGYIVNPEGTHDVWKATGVNEINGFMRVWGPHFTGDRLDAIIDEANPSINLSSQHISRQKALQAIVYWIRAKMLLGETHSALNPGASFIFLEGKSDRQKGSVFFTPANLSNRCLLVEGRKLDRFNCPDLLGIDAVAFCAGVMLYKVLTNLHPYQYDATIFQDMREGVFLPPHLAAPSLDRKFCKLIHAALLLPVEKRKTDLNGADILESLLKILMTADTVIPASSLFFKLSSDENKQLEKEKNNFLFRQNNSVKFRRFVMRNKHALMGLIGGLFFAGFIIVSTTMSINQRPTTVGMPPDMVISAYYDAFSSLDHVFMEACIQGADKSDVNAAISLFAIYKTRQAYESSARSNVIPARLWKETGGELPAPDVFGVTDLEMEYLAGREEENMIIYRVNYLLWSPEEFSISRSDTLTLKRDRKKNWRITEILREER